MSTVAPVEVMKDPVLESYRIIRKWAMKQYGMDGEDYAHSAYVELFSERRVVHTMKLSLEALQVEWRLYVGVAMNKATEERRGVIHFSGEDFTTEEVVQLPQDKHLYVKGVIRNLPFASRKLMYRLVIDRATVSETAKEFGITRRQVQCGYDKGVRQLHELLVAQSEVA